MVMIRSKGKAKRISEKIMGEQGIKPPEKIKAVGLKKARKPGMIRKGTVKSKY